jgi:hypothetical protein
LCQPALHCINIAFCDYVNMPTSGSTQQHLTVAV